MSSEVSSAPAATPAIERKVLTGWGQVAGTVADVASPTTVDEVSALMATRGPRGVIPRGLGRAYGDAAQDSGGLVVDLTGLDSTLRVDHSSHQVTASAGHSLDHLMRVLVPQGYWVPVSPGTRNVSLGGALAADVHGKNHHVDGSFGNAVRELTLVTPGGDVRTLTPDGTPEEFWATVGGMGLTGAIVEARFDVHPIETSRASVDTERANNLDEALAMMSASDDQYRYTVTWIDLMAKGAHIGRSVLTRGDFATLDQLPAKLRDDPLAYGPKVLAAAPPWAPPKLLNRATIGAFNEMWFRKAPKVRRGEIQSIPVFFHPLDMVSGWNRLYGHSGFIQYQFMLPFGAEETLRSIIGSLSSARVVSFLTVLKRFGPGNPGYLSFPKPGWTLAMDLPLGQEKLRELLPRFDEQVVEAGGRHYFAKDSTISPRIARAGYPRLDEWRAVRDRLDPDRVMASDLSRRLDLLGDSPAGSDRGTR